jgi:hypothetical protein
MLIYYFSLLSIELIKLIIGFIVRFLSELVIPLTIHFIFLKSVKEKAWSHQNLLLLFQLQIDLNFYCIIL